MGARNRECLVGRAVRDLVVCSVLNVFEPNPSPGAQASACLRDTIEELRIVL
jgi:hypothetical protein